ncbi:hypothetical protein VTG60DRAFT_376 [Thermothelomyces hinnuleus]
MPVTDLLPPPTPLHSPFFWSLSFPLFGAPSRPFASFLNSSLTAINALPSRFSPHLFLMLSALAALNPIPQIRSSGLASTISLSPVRSSSSRMLTLSLPSPPSPSTCTIHHPSSGSTGRVNLSRLPRRTISSRRASHTASEKLDTFRPRALTSRGSGVARISAPTSGSEKRTAFWYIM